MLHFRILCDAQPILDYKRPSTVSSSRVAVRHKHRARVKYFFKELSSPLLKFASHISVSRVVDSWRSMGHGFADRGNSPRTE